MSKPTESFSTPLLASRTLHSISAAPATTGGISRLPLRRPSLSNSNESFNPSVTMTAGRIPTLRRPSSAGSGEFGLTQNAPATASRLPVTSSLSRRSSISGLRASALPLPNGPTATPGRSTLVGIHKRSSTAAGLEQEGELSITKRQLTSTTHDLLEQKLTSERHLMEANTANSSLQAQLKEALSKLDVAQRQRASLLAKERESTECDLHDKEELEKQRNELKKELRETRNALGKLQEDKISLGEILREVKHSERQALAGLKEQTFVAEELEKELDVEREARERRDAELREEREKSRSREAVIERLEGELKGQENVGVVKEELHRQVLHLRSLEKENQKLTREVGTYKIQKNNTEVLKEAKKALENKLRGMDELRQRNAILEAEADQFRREKLEWQSFLLPAASTTPSSLPEFSTPRKLASTLSATRLNNAALLSDLHEKEVALSTRDKIIGELEGRVEELEAEIGIGLKALEDARRKEAEVTRREGLRGLEVQMLKNSLATYDTEESLHLSTTSFDAQKSLRLTQLEELLQAYQYEMKELSSSVSHWRGLVERYGGNTTDVERLVEHAEESKRESERIAGGAGESVVKRHLEEILRKNESLSEELSSLKTSQAVLVAELTSFEHANDQLTYTHNNGAFDPRTTKVLQLSTNPDSLEMGTRLTTLEGLREENRQLLDELQRKSAGGGEDVVPSISFENLQREKNLVDKLLAKKEILETRLVKAWTIKADEVRKVIMSLLGYRIDFLPSGLVKLSSLYAPNSGFALHFSSSGNDVGTMSLSMGNEAGSAGNGANGGEVMQRRMEELKVEIGELTRDWVLEKGSVPGFLACLQLRLWEDHVEAA